MGRRGDPLRSSRSGDACALRMRADEKWYNLAGGAKDEVLLTYETMRTAIPRVAAGQLRHVDSSWDIASLEVTLTPSRFDAMTRTAREMTAAALSSPGQERSLPYPLSTFHGSTSAEVMRVIAERGYRMPGEADPVTGS